MKFPRISFLPLLFIPFLSCDTKGDFEDDFKNYFVKYYGEDGDQEAVDFVLNSDGSILLLGKTDSPDGKKRILLVKVNSDGNVLWQRTYGSGFDTKNRSIDENPQDIEPMPNGDFLILSNMFRGVNGGTNENDWDFKVIRIQPDGTKLDSMEWGNNPDSAVPGDWTTQFVKSITPFSDNGFGVVGNSTNEEIYLEGGLPIANPDQEDLFAIVFDNTYAKKWNSVENNPGIGSARGEYIGSGVKIFENGANGYVMFSYSDAPKQNAVYEPNFNLFGFTVDGLPASINPVDPDDEFAGQSLNPPQVSSEILASVTKVPSLLGGGFYEIGTKSNSSTTPLGDLYFCRRNNNFAKMDEGEINGLGNLTAVAVSPSSVSEGFLLLADETTATGKIIKLINVNLSSGVRWSANFGSPEKSGNKAANVAELPDGRILVFCTIELETQLKMALIKVNRKGELLN